MQGPILILRCAHVATFVTPDLIRGPERHARLVLVALDNRLREYDGA